MKNSGWLVRTRLLVLAFGFGLIGVAACDPEPGLCPDEDADGRCDELDLCLGDDLLGDEDGDGVCGGCNDRDDDGVCNSVDICEGDDALGDEDGDGVCGLCADDDSDGICNARDQCLGDDSAGDQDNDRICDDIDLCLGDNRTGDSDDDGTCDDADICFGDIAFGDMDEDGLCGDVDPCDDRFNPNFEPICNVHFVDVAAPLFGDGGSWATAHSHIETALVRAEPGDEIWVKAGVYAPWAASMDVYLRLDEEVAVYGGFDGTERLREERAGLFNETVITGDFLGNDDPADLAGSMTDNPSHLVRSARDAVLDGFLITGAYHASEERTGAGLWVEEPMTLRNVTFTEIYGNNLTEQGARAVIFSSPNPSNDPFVMEDVTVLGGDVPVFAGWSGESRIIGLTAIGTERIANFGSSTLTVSHASVRPRPGSRAFENNGGFVRIYNTAVWTEGVSPFGLGGVNVIFGSCANTDFTTITGNVALDPSNVFLDGSTPALSNPFAESDDGHRLYLKHAIPDGVDSACIDTGDVAWADLSNPSLRSTASDGTVDNGEVDAGAAYLNP